MSLCNRVFSLTWPASMQIYWKKRKRLHKKGVQLPQDQTASSLSFSSDLVRAMHARGSAEAARRAKRERQPLPSRAVRHARGHLRVSRFARRTTQKRETAHSLHRTGLGHQYGRRDVM